MITDVQAIIDWVGNTLLNVFNAMRSAGIYFYVWIAAFFVFPWFKRLIRALRGS